ncbi:MAG TPA: hypothetical protein PK725_01170 [Rhodocyclaceae bacterium]|nr:hypothetical protein [Rhodocyclaceae bacterium]
MNSIDQFQSIPTVELQLAAFIESALEQKRFRQAELQANGFYVSLMYDVTFDAAGLGSLRDCVAIVEVFVPPRFRRQGWFAHFCNLCLQLGCGAVICSESCVSLRPAMVKAGFDARGEGYLVLD